MLAHAFLPWPHGCSLAESTGGSVAESATIRCYKVKYWTFQGSILRKLKGPDHLVFSNANVTITQCGRTNMTVICQSASGVAETNRIVVSGWLWRWGSNRLEYAQTAIGPGFGFGVFPGISTFKSRCYVEAVRTNDHAHQTLRITLTNQVGGVMLPFGPWSDPEDSSEIILTPVVVP